MKSLVVTMMLLAGIGSAWAQSAAEVKYDITVQNEVRQQSKVVILPVGGEARALAMAGGIVQIEPPAAEGGASTIKLLTADKPNPALLHTARIELPQGSSVTVAYSLCNGAVKYESPRPEKLQKCSE